MEETMTEDRLSALNARRAVRDKHPARSARVLITGVSVSALASLVSAFTVQAAANSQPSSLPVDPDPTIAPLDQVAVPLAPPTTPAPATPVRQVVEINVIQPPTPVQKATTPPVVQGGGGLGGLDWNGAGGGLGSIGGGGGSSGSSGGSG
jgi:uncharacterized membrane protein YgcG